MATGTATTFSLEALHPGGEDLPRWTRMLTKILAAGTVCVVAAGGAVTSTGSGLADRHWPTFDGQLLPSPQAMLDDRGKLFEHGHRLVAASAVLLTWAVAIALWLLPEPRRWVRWLGIAAGVAGLVPALFGGLTVLFELPAALSVVHVGAAHIFLGLNVALAVVTGKRWSEARSALNQDALELGDASWMGAAGVLLAGALYLQIILGAIPRHAGHAPAAIGVHILWAFVVITAVVVVAARVFSRHARLASLLRPALTLLFLAIFQFLLGFTTFVTLPSKTGETAGGLHQLVASVHQAAGALMLAAAVVLMLRAVYLRHLLKTGAAAA